MIKGKQIRVFIAEDSEMFAKALMSSINLQPDMQVVGHVHDQGKLLDRINIGMVDVLILDIFEPFDGFINLVKNLKAKDPSLCIIILSGRVNIPNAFETQEAGARGYIYKDNCQPNELFEVIRKLHADKRAKTMHLPPESTLDCDAEEAKNRITRLQRQVIALLIQGFTSKEISHYIGKVNGTSPKPSPGTVATHRRDIRANLREFGITNDASLGYWVAKWNLLQGDELDTKTD